MGNVTYSELIAAGYKPEEILPCPLNDNRGYCPCEKNGPHQNCGLSKKEQSIKEEE